MIKNLNLDKIFQILLIILAFLMPLTVFGGNLIIVVICILWLFSGSYKYKLDQIVNNKLMLASILFFCLHVVGLLWTNDLAWGMHITHKMWYFIGLFPILYTIVRKDYIRHYISAFLLAISFTEVCSYLVWFEIIEPFKNATIQNPTPFMSHISYNPILVIAIYIVLHELLFNKKLKTLKFSIYSFLTISMTMNMFITGGRAGQVMFFAMLVLLIFQFFNNQRIKPLLVTLFLIPGVFFSAYITSDLFQQRVDGALDNLVIYSEHKQTPVGERLTFALNSWEIIKKHPIIGVGTGDFPEEYKKINQARSPKLPNATNPHNMYTLVLTQLGLMGFISLLSIFYYEIKLSFNSPNKFIRDAGITFPLLFLIIMLSDSYLLGHYTTLVFVFFSSFLYKDFENS
jgi:O-antigen ligase